jgi:AraC-like DNA-binding protein
MDMLSRITDTIEGSQFQAHSLGGASELRFACSYTAAFHIVLRGECLLRCETSNQLLELAPGDIVFFSRGQYHELRARAAQGQSTGEPDAQARIMSGRYRFPAGPLHPLFHALPRWFHLPARNRSLSDPITPVITVLAGEYERLDRSAAVLSRLTDTLFHFILRHALLDEPESAPWQRLYADVELQSAIEAMETNPGYPWRVDELAARAALSRAAFSRRFKQGTGMSPLAYLTRIRMVKALALLRDEGETVERVAAAVGYESAFAFSRRFKELYGQPPSSYRAPAPAAAPLAAPAAGPATPPAAEPPALS